MTGFYEVYNDFYRRFPEVEIDYLEPTETKGILLLALVRFKAVARILKIDYDNDEIEDLTDVEISLLASLMFDEYLAKQLREYNKIINLSSEVVKITGAQDRVKNLRQFRLDNKEIINDLQTSLLLDLRNDG